MAKSTLPTRKLKSSVRNEKQAANFIDGAATANEDRKPAVKKKSKKKGVLLNLFPSEIDTIDRLAGLREPRPIKRTAWILEAIAEKIKREEEG